MDKKIGIYVNGGLIGHCELVNLPYEVIQASNHPDVLRQWIKEAIEAEEYELAAKYQKMLEEFE